MSGRTIAVIPDTQVKDGVPTEHLEAYGNYIADKRPDTVVHLGDHFDMPSLSTHSPRASMEYEGKRYIRDLEAGWDGLNKLMLPIEAERNRMKKNKKKVWNPDLHFCMGNHEYRRDRLIGQEPYLEGGLVDYDIENWGFEVHPFLEPVRLGGVNFAHYAQGGAMGRPISRAHLIAAKKHESWVVGHQQVLDIYISPHVKTDGARVQAVIAGAFYNHEEEYMKYQGNQHWRGAMFLHEVKDGQFDLMTLSMDYLLKEWL